MSGEARPCVTRVPEKGLSRRRRGGTAQRDNRPTSVGRLSDCEMTMATEPKTLGEWETRTDVDRFSTKRLTVEEATLSVLLSIRVLSVGYWDCRYSGWSSW